MFFNKSLQQENQRLKQELYSLQQIQQSLDEEMLRLTLDAKGNVTSANQKFLQQLSLSDKDILAKHISDLVPSNVRNTDHFYRMKQSVQAKAFWNGAFQITKGMVKKRG